MNQLRNLRGSARDRRRICPLPCAFPQPIPPTPEQHRGLLTVPLLKHIQSEVEYDTRLVLEIVLTAGGGVVEASVKIIYLGRPECDCTRMVDRNVQASAKRKGKAIARGGLGEHHARRFQQIPVYVGVRSTQEDVAEGPDFSGSDPDLWTEQISEQVPLHVGAAAEWANATPRGGGESLRVAAVALQVHLDTNILGEVEVERATTSVETVAAGVGVAGVVTSIAVIRGHLKFRGIICHRCQPGQHNDPCDQYVSEFHDFLSIRSSLEKSNPHRFHSS